MLRSGIQSPRRPRLQVFLSRGASRGRVCGSTRIRRGGLGDVLASLREGGVDDSRIRGHLRNTARLMRIFDYMMDEHSKCLKKRFTEKPEVI